MYSVIFNLQQRLKGYPLCSLYAWGPIVTITLEFDDYESANKFRNNLHNHSKNYLVSNIILNHPVKSC